MSFKVSVEKVKFMPNDNKAPKVLDTFIGKVIGKAYGSQMIYNKKCLSVVRKYKVSIGS